MAKSTNSINDQVTNNSFSIVASSNGGKVSETISQTSNSAGVSAYKAISVAGTSAGNPYHRIAVGTTSQYALGIKVDSSNQFVLSYAASGAVPSSTAKIMTVQTAGQTNFPLNAAFWAYRSSSTNDQSGAGAMYTVIPDTEQFDPGSDFTPVSGTFTAPVTGKYHLGFTIGWQNISAAMTQGWMFIVTTSKTFPSNYFNWNKMTVADNLATNSMACLFSMTAGDTAVFQSRLSNGAGNTADVYGNATPMTHCWGYLVG